MLTRLLDTVTAFRQQHPASFHLFTAAVVYASVAWAVLEFFKPIGKRRAKNSTKQRLPPGHPGAPLFGYLLDLKKADGPSLRSKVLLNSHRVTEELIAKRGSQTNTRSPMPVSSGLVSRDRRSLLLPADEWTERRRVMHGLLNGTALRQYGAWQEQESAQMMAEYVLRPDRWYRHHYRYANSVVVRIALGERPHKSRRELEEMQNAVAFFVGSIGRSIVDWFPDLARLPRRLQVWRPYWAALRRWNHDLYSKWYHPVRDRVRDGTAPPSFVRDHLMHPDTRFRGDDDDLMYMAMQLIEAGSDTTREALNIMAMAALERPEAFAAARAEVDRLCGAGRDARPPVLADMASLPYVCATAKEVLRRHPIFPLTPDHVASQDIEFEGYYFPAGTGFTINGVAVCDECNDPRVFRPERWLDGHETDIAHGLWQFGGGGRICVGYRLAQRSLFINIARLAQCVDYRPTMSSLGRPSSAVLIGFSVARNNEVVN
ncbi:cytochrome P450 [Microdochium trichocladiopsis]|uniref:Cytochrome P450 n=1 Tax=Microdochium trichocladiopsis TaxID=1682393 RepID=A0A9P9BF63_9PEZI|nr:cytochrome P450 [Microdochium trichocladiopsis]KAH7010605.1 cytochrome P450 [Microdochium trichocladiopsis]